MHQIVVLVETKYNYIIIIIFIILIIINNNNIPNA
jgi:hypothetical protein